MVLKPKSTRFLYQLDGKTASSSQKTVTLTLEHAAGTAASSPSGSQANSLAVTPPGVVSAVTPPSPSRAAMTHSVSSPTLQGVWKKPDFVAVTLPETSKGGQVVG